MSFDGLVKQDLEQKRYWNVDFSKTRNGLSLRDWSEEFRELMKSSIKLRLNSDVPLAIFLSGGMDSSVIASEANTIRKQLNVFTVNFDFSGLSEISMVKELIREYPEIDHHIIDLSAEVILDDLDWLNNLDEPISDSSLIPTYWISKIVRDSG